MGDGAATAAVVVYGTAMVVLLVLRSWQQRRATGSSGFHGFTGMASGGADRLAGVSFLAAVILGLVSPVLAALHLLPAGDGGANWVMAGFTVAAAGVGLGVVAQQTMGASWRIGVDPAERTTLVTGGVFALVRNPIFTGLIAVQVGTAVMAPTGMAALGVAAMVVACQVQVRLVEEPYLLGAHGGAYAGYASHTGRFVPGLGRLRPANAVSAGSPTFGGPA